MKDLEDLLNVDVPQLMEQLPASLYVARSADAAFGVFGPASTAPVHATPVAHDAPPQPPRRAPQAAKSAAAAPPVPPRSSPAGGGAPNPFEAAPAPNPFELAPKAAAGPAWALEAKKAELVADFESFGPAGGLLDANSAREALMRTSLPNDHLFKVWELSDMDKDGALDLDEFTVAMHLCEQAADGGPVPDELPLELVPPSKRG